MSEFRGARAYLMLLLFAKTYQQLQVRLGKILFDMVGCHEASLAQNERPIPPPNKMQSLTSYTYTQTLQRVRPFRQLNFEHQRLVVKVET